MSTSTDYPVVGPRERCPCGSGKRYKACHGKKSRAASRRYVSRTFEGLPGECDWVAMREIVSAATAKVAAGDREVMVTTLLPGAAPAMVHSDGRVLLGLQTATSTGDTSADLAHALVTAIASEPGRPVAVAPRPDDSPRLQDLLDRDVALDVTMHSGFDYWIDPSLDEEPPEMRTMVDAANDAIVPCARLSSVEAAYWCDLGDRVQVRWVQPYEEEPLLNGLARLHAQEADDFGDGTRLLGTFRAHGLLVPVWDLADGTTAEQVEDSAAGFAARLAEAVSQTAPLTAEQRRARAGLANRQVTIR